MSQQRKGNTSAVAERAPKKNDTSGSNNASQEQNNSKMKTTSQTSEMEQVQQKVKAKSLLYLEQVNKELWLILSMFIIVGLMNYFVVSHRILLGLYTLPTLFSAYFYGRRHATLTAIASILLVCLGAYYNPAFVTKAERLQFLRGQLYDIVAWGSMLIIMAYAMGTLYEHRASQIKELRTTYQGVLIILRHFISKDEFSENHCYRVSHFAAKIAAYLGFTPERIEDIRSAGLLHDIGKLEVSRELLFKASKFTQKEFEGLKRYAKEGIEIMHPFAGPLGRIIPIILAHQGKNNGSRFQELYGKEIPLEARVLTVADVYDTMISEHPYRKPILPAEAKDIITKGTGKEYDQQVVEAFVKAFNKGDLEIANVGAEMG